MNLQTSQQGEEFGGESLLQAFKILLEHAKQVDEMYPGTGDAVIEMAEIVLKRHESHPTPLQWPTEEEIETILRQTYEKEFNPKSVPEQYAVKDTDDFMFTYGHDIVKAIFSWLKS